jgi:acetyl esterase/lipase
VARGLDVVRELVMAGQGRAPSDLAGARAQMDSYEQPLPEGTSAATADVGGVPGLWLRRTDGVPGRVVLFLHGGGYTVGSTRSHRRLAAMVGVACRADVLSIDYRLAPEHPCPAGLDDAVAVHRWLVEQGVSDVVVAGDSAGGGLALATALATRDAGLAPPGALVLLAPWLDLTLSGSSVTTRAAEDFMLDAEHLRQCAAAYAGELALDDWRVSPLDAELAGLPPVFVQVGDADLLVDDAIRLADRGRRAGVAVSLDVAPEMPHVFQSFAGLLPDADAALARVGEWVEEVLSR